MLIVVHDRDIHLFFEPLLDLETLRGLDVFQVHPTEGWLQNFHRPDKFVHIFGVQFNVEHINVGVDFKQQPFALHDGLAGFGANVAKAQHGCSVGDNGHEVAFARVFINVFDIFGNGQAGFGYAGRVGQ